MMGNTMENKSKECDDVITCNREPILACGGGIAILASLCALRLRDGDIPKSSHA